MVIMFSAFEFVLGNSDVLLSFGFQYESNFLYLFIFANLYTPINFGLQFATMYLTRKFEYEADAYAVTYGHGKALKKGLVSLFKRNKAPLVADPFYSALNHSHPTLVERLQAIDIELKTKE